MNWRTEQLHFLFLRQCMFIFYFIFLHFLQCSVIVGEKTDVHCIMLTGSCHWLVSTVKKIYWVISTASLSAINCWHVTFFYKITILHCISKTFNVLLATLSNLNRFSHYRTFTARKPLKFAIRNRHSFPPHRDYVATLSWEVRCPNMWYITKDAT